MTRVGVNTLKDDLSRYLELASGGERVVVTDQGRPIAQPTQVAASNEATEVWDLVQAGVATWDGGKPRGSANPPRVRGKTAAEMVIEDRR